MDLAGLIFSVCIFFGTGNPYMRSILKPEVELMVFLRMRSNKITKNAEKAIKYGACRPNFPRVYIFRHGKSEDEVLFETGSIIKGVSAHAQQYKSRKTPKNP